MIYNAFVSLYKNLIFFTYRFDVLVTTSMTLIQQKITDVTRAQGTSFIDTGRVSSVY